MKSLSQIIIATCLVLASFFQLQAQIKIAFFLHKLSYRGVEVSTYDYAHYNETLLGNKSIIINQDTKTFNDVRNKFVKRFGDSFFDCVNMQEMNAVLEHEQVDIFYIQKSGAYDEKISSVCKNAVHVIFLDFQPHGDVYAGISYWLSSQYSAKRLPTVPYMVDLPDVHDSLREKLNIPKTAIVFGCHGGFTSFDTKFAREAVKKVADTKPNVFFVFLGMQPFCMKPNVIFLPSTTDLLYKTKFINTCDAMIHARARGETFGLACAEFSIKNKPVITYYNPREKAHIDMLGNKGIYYHNKQDLIDILNTFTPDPTKNWDAYSKLYNPQAVMAKFNEVFIQPLLSKDSDHPNSDFFVNS